MTKEKFRNYWQLQFPESLPVGHLFRHNYAEKWLRIHSLPAAKRYAETDLEWQILLERQNTIINDLVPQNALIQVVVYYIREDNSLFKKYHFQNIGVTVDKINETVYQSFWIEVVWQKDALNDILIEIADDNIEAFFIVDKTLIAPYDGGMDIIFSDKNQVSFYKNKYVDWLSERPDGL